jgi:uncharacterized protein YlzI (FlbEa/FlbD family)
MRVTHADGSEIFINVEAIEHMQHFTGSAPYTSITFSSGSVAVKETPAHIIGGLPNAPTMRG